MEKPLYTGVLAWVVILLSGIIIRFIWCAMPIMMKAISINQWRYRGGRSRFDYVMETNLKQGLGGLRQKTPAEPWFILLGEKCGKSQLLDSHRTVSLFGEGRTKSVVPTRTLRWWFFQTSVVLEMGSTFLNRTPVLAKAWGRLIAMLRHMPAPSGVLIAVSLATLQDENGQESDVQARFWRQRSDAIMRAVNKRLPVYLLITGCSEDKGFSFWSGLLSEAQKKHPLGYLWSHPPVVDGNDDEWLMPLFDAVTRGFFLTRSAALSGDVPDDELLEHMDFPETFVQLKPALQKYLSILCEPGHRAEYLTLGGVFFTSERHRPGGLQADVLFSTSLIDGAISEHVQASTTAPLNPWKNWGRQTVLPALALLCCSGLALCLFSALPLFQGRVTELALPELTTQAVETEARLNTWSSLPLHPLLKARLARLENRIVELQPLQVFPVESDLAHLNTHFIRSSLSERRRMLLELAQTLEVMKKLRDGRPLQELRLMSGINPVGSDGENADSMRIAQRVVMQKPEGKLRIDALRHQLRQLLAQDKNMSLLSAPDPELAPLSIRTVSSGFTNGPTLDGIWSADGWQKMTLWLNAIQQAAGPDGHVNISAILSEIQTKRQQAWLNWLTEISRLPIPLMSNDQWRGLLLDIDQNNGPGISLSRLTEHELADIPWTEATNWLRMLRQMNSLQGEKTLDPLISHSGQIEQRLRGKITGLLKMRAPAGAHSSRPAISPSQAWSQWRQGVRAATAFALEMPANSDGMLSALFSPEQGKNANPLQKLNALFFALSNSLANPNPGYDTTVLWNLWRLDQRLLVAQGVQHVGCWIQHRWQEDVLWPLEKQGRKRDLQAQQQRAEDYVNNFIHRFGPQLLDTSHRLPEAIKFEKQSIPLTDDFLKLAASTINPDDLLPVTERAATREGEKAEALKQLQLQLEQQQQALGEKAIPVTITSGLASVPAGARVMPTGTRLTMQCDEKSTVLESMNFSEQAIFMWRPGHCTRLNLRILFPDFTLQLNYSGTDALPAFIAEASSGSILYDSERFGSEQPALRAMGIDRVIVGYQIEGGDDVLSAREENLRISELLSKNQNELQALQSTMEPGTSGKTILLSRLPGRVAGCGSLPESGVLWDRRTY